MLISDEYMISFYLDRLKQRRLSLTRNTTHYNVSLSASEKKGVTVLLLPKRVVFILCTIVCGLLLAGFSSQILKFYIFGGEESPWWFVRLANLVDLDKENNLPTWYSSTALFANSVLLGLIGWAKRHDSGSYAKHWLVLAGILLLLSADEAASLHEMTSRIAESLLNRVGLMSDYFYYGWVVFGIGAVMIVGVLYLRFIMDLPKETRLWFLFAGFLFAGGAIGPELLEAKIFAVENKVTMTFMLLVVVEEGMEMFGVVASIYATLSYMNRKDMRISLLRLHQDVVGNLPSDQTPPSTPSRRFPTLKRAG